MNSYITNAKHFTDKYFTGYNKNDFAELETMAETLGLDDGWECYDNIISFFGVEYAGVYVPDRQLDNFIIWRSNGQNIIAEAHDRLESLEMKLLYMAASQQEDRKLHMDFND